MPRMDERTSSTTPTSTVRLVRGHEPQGPALDVAVTRALLQRAAAGKHPDTLRVYTPPRVVAFGRQDVRHPGFKMALRAAVAGGFQVVRRFAGARTVAMHEGVVVFEYVVADGQAQVHFQQRNVEVAGVVAQGLRAVGVDARLGDVFREYDPSAYSVNARGQVKLASLQQRLIPGAALVTGHTVVTGAPALRAVLTDVNEHLDFDWRPASLGAVDEVAVDVTVDRVRDAVVSEFATRDLDLVDGRIDPDVLDVARALAPEHALPNPTGAY